eukprot:5100690-Pleurochrysis_carterae.AAC.1
MSAPRVPSTRTPYGLQPHAHGREGAEEVESRPPLVHDLAAVQMEAVEVDPAKLKSGFAKAVEVRATDLRANGFARGKGRVSRDGGGNW